MKKMMIEVDVDEVLKMKEKLRHINKKAFDQISWVRDGKQLEFSAEEAEEFKFTGLCNTDFLEVWLDVSTVEQFDD